MARRKDVRVAVIQILYAIDLGNEKMLDMAESFLRERKIINNQAEFAMLLINGVFEKHEFILDTMNIFLKTWSIERLGVIEKNILKLGIYEILFTDTERAIIINEAIELTKIFNVMDAFRLVNGILDSVHKVGMEEIRNKIKHTKLLKSGQDNHTIAYAAHTMTSLPSQDPDCTNNHKTLGTNDHDTHNSHDNIKQESSGTQHNKDNPNTKSNTYKPICTNKKIHKISIDMQTQPKQHMPQATQHNDVSHTSMNKHNQET